RHNLPQPFPLFGDRLVPASLQLLLHLLELRPYAVAPGLPVDQECALARFSADEREPKEHERLRFAEPALLAVHGRGAAELDQAGLLRMEQQCKRLKPRPHRIEEVTSVVLLLEADNQIVSVSHDDHVASGLAPSPARSPQVEAVMQVDIGQEW